MNHKTKDFHPITQLSHQAFEEAEPYHRSMLEEVSNYKNVAISGREQYGINSKEVGGTLEFPQAGEIVDRLVPAFKAELAKVELHPQKQMESDDDPRFVEDLQDILEQHEEAGNDSLINESMIEHFLICGNFISMVHFDSDSHTVRAPVIPPWQFAPDPVTDIDLDSADYVVRRTYQTNEYVKARWSEAPLTDYKPDDGELNKGNNVVDRLWIKSQYAKSMDLGINGIDDTANMVVAVVVNDEPQSAVQDPIAYPSFPFAKGTNYSQIDSRKGLGFWGAGYTQRSRSEEVAYNNFLSAYLDIVSELPHNRLITTEGAIPVNSILNIPGSVIQLMPGKSLADVEVLRSEQPPTSMLQAIGILRESLQNKAVSLSPVFTGGSPGANTSGKAIISLQGATYNQISGKVASLNEARRKRVEIRVHVIQSQYNLPTKPNQWRYGGRFVLLEDARFVGFDAVVPDNMGIPNTLAGRVSLLQTLAGLGYMLKTERLADFLRLGSSFGLSMDDLIPIPQPQSQQPVNFDALAGVV